MSNLWNKATGMIGMGPRGHSKHKKPIVPQMPDTEELRKVARKKQALLAKRGGRASTILDNEETLG